MAAPNVNGRLHLTGVLQKPPALLLKYAIGSTICNILYYYWAGQCSRWSLRIESARSVNILRRILCVELLRLIPT